VGHPYRLCFHVASHHSNSLALQVSHAASVDSVANNYSQSTPDNSFSEFKNIFSRKQNVSKNRNYIFLKFNILFFQKTTLFFRIQKYFFSEIEITHIFPEIEKKIYS